MRAEAEHGRLRDRVRGGTKPVTQIHRRFFRLFTAAWVG
jgi:hypothetical protein